MERNLKMDLSANDLVGIFKKQSERVRDGVNFIATEWLENMQIQSENFSEWKSVAELVLKAVQLTPIDNPETVKQCFEEIEKITKQVVDSFDQVENVNSEQFEYINSILNIANKSTERLSKCNKLQEMIDEDIKYYSLLNSATQKHQENMSKK